MKLRALQLLLLATFSTSAAMGQIDCTPGTVASKKLVCGFPFSTGALQNANILGLSSGNANSALQTATAINIGIATQVSQLPLASASAGTIVVYKAGVPTTINNLGPILVDRAQVIGKGKVFVGFTASQYVFTNIDGVSLSNLPFAFSQTTYSGTNSSTPTSTTFTSSLTNLSFRLNQFVGVATVGLSNRVDFSVIVPIERVSLAAFTPSTTSYVEPTGSSVAAGPVSGSSISASGSASGVGDISFNAKGELWSGEHATVSGGLTVRTPTGDDLNFLGSGAWGINLYAVYSYLAKVSPHAKVAYQWNTSTELNNPTQKFGQNQSLPGGMQYDAGADWGVSRHITIAGDILGTQFLNTPTYTTTTTSLEVASSPTATPTSTKITSSNVVNSSYTVSNVSTGIKINPFRELVLSANVLFQITDNGLRARPTPLVGISYKF